MRQLLYCSVALTMNVLSMTTLAQHVASTPRGDATQSDILSRPITVTLENATILSAVNIVASRANVRVVYHAEQFDTITRRVTLHVEQLPLGMAMDRVLDGSGFQAVWVAGELLYIRPVVPTASTGIIVGTIVDASTKRPIAQATVSLDDSRAGGVTDEHGGFRIAGVTAGIHRVSVRRIGYARAFATVTVGDHATANLDVGLTASANTLDQVVVTGTVIQTELKAVPNAITIITGQELETRGITHIDQLFHGDVPGLHAINQGSTATTPGKVKMASRGSTEFEFAGNDALTQTIKTYVDGIELADPSSLGLIDPKSIDRIEILTGPQASTIYGSNAINGVMQVFTKRGQTARPQMTVNLESGLIQSNNSSGMTPQHDYSANVSGVEGHASYNVGGGWSYQGPWTPAIHLATTGMFGGAHFGYGRVSGDLSFRRTQSTNWQGGDTQAQNIANVANGTYSAAALGINTTGGIRNYREIAAAQTLGGKVMYTPWSWWSHTFTVGTDESESEFLSALPSYRTVNDTLGRIIQPVSTRMSVAYTTTADLPLNDHVRVNLTVGADGWHTLFTQVATSAPSLTGTLTTSSTSISRQPGHDHGAFVQGQLGMAESLFLTYGLRAEWNPYYGQDVNPNFVPRYGIAYSQALGDVTVKVRTSYGRATRPPAPLLKQSAPLDPSFVTYFGNVDQQLANDALLPEFQQGGEGGLELYWGSRGSLIVTRYNQTVDNLIENVPRADSVDANAATKLLYGLGNWQYVLYQHENLNLGSVRNQGWELQGTFNVGPVSARGTYSWTKSRVIGLAPTYRAQFSNTQFLPGSMFSSLPEHTWALGFQYVHAGTSVSYNVQGQGQQYNTSYSNDLLDALSNVTAYARLPILSPRVVLPSVYRAQTGGYALADVNVLQHMSRYVDGLLQIQNLMNSYQSDVGAGNTTIGRQTKVGVRLRY